jgi:protein SCO1/2
LLHSSFFVSSLLLTPAASATNRWGANYFPNVPLTTQDGQTVHLYDDLLKGKTVVVSLFYSECQDSCPPETARLVQVQRMLGDHVGKDVFFYSISIDPEHDTPAVLKAYAEKFHVGPGWLFLTGKKADIDIVGRNLDLDADPTLNRDGHTVDLMIGNEPTGQWLRNSAN